MFADRILPGGQNEKKYLGIPLTLLLFTACGRFSFGQPFTFKVKHDHWRGGCTGNLMVDEQGIEFSSEDTEHSRKWRYTDLKRIVEGWLRLFAKAGLAGVQATA